MLMYVSSVGQSLTKFFTWASIAGADTALKAVLAAGFAIPRRTDSNRTLESLLKQKVKEHVKDFEEYCPANVYVSVIIAYPAKMIDSMRPRPDIDFEAITARRAFLRPRPRKNFNDNDLQQRAIRVAQCNFAKSYPKSHIDFMDGTETPVKRPAVDKQEQDDPKKTKMV
ncbi:hypothetical protein EC957_003862 [Mortierella hygrophila]|uniref:Uncharacterized protein n=1 Tax=Mortierella hygrophila TaxID=979708 RepID=A0A9P6K073_9FUNG|nr:hypothetical protein EC957_003862 [Mortierella hygrophila]